MLDEASPFSDYSGYGRSGTATGTVTTSVPLAAGAVYSTVFGNNALGKFASPVFQQGLEDRAFSLESWIRPIVTDTTEANSDLQVLGNSGEYDGLVWNGTTISFSTKYLTTGECRAEYDLQVSRAIQAVGVHTSEKNMLFVEGELVAETDITDAQKADQYVATDGFLYSGSTAGTMQLAAGAVGIYNYALSPQTVKNHFESGRHVVGRSVTNGHPTTVIDFSTDMSNLLRRRVFDTDADWNSGFFSGLVIDNNMLVPQVINDTSVTGTWFTVCDLYDGGTPNPLSAVNMEWDGEGVTVEASVDGDTWETAVRGENLEIIPSGFDPANKELHLRVSFPGGIVEDDSYIDSLTVNLFKSNIVTVGSRTLTLTQPADIRTDREPVQLADDWGLTLRGGTISISSAASPKTIEVWAKRNSADAVAWGTNLDQAEIFYSNGAVGTEYPVGEWVVRHFVSSTPLNGVTAISGNVSIGRVVFYDDALTATQISNIVASYFGVPVTRVGDNSVIAIAEPPVAAEIYAHDWSIEASG